LPIASAPFPKESDLRTIPAAVSSVTGLEPLALARTPEADGATPYFMQSAGALHLPSAMAVPELPTPPRAPSAPAAPSMPSVAAAPAVPPAPPASGLQTLDLELFEVRCGFRRIVNARIGPS
jgi:hypothetical protein